VRIRRISLRNFRPYRSQKLLFYREYGKRDLFVIYGITGKGKSTFLDAIHWALYGMEFQMRGNNTTIFNRARLSEMKEGERDYVEVLIEIESDTGISSIRRRADFIKKEGGAHKIAEEVEFVDENGIKYTDVNAVSAKINGFIPRRVKNFFLMDGENLTRRFFSNSSRALAEEIRDMVQLDVVDDAIVKLRNIKQEKDKEYAEGNESLKKIMSEKIKVEGDLNKAKDELEEISEEIVRLKNEIEELRRELTGIPDVSQLRKKVELLRRRLKEKNALLEDKIQKKREIILKYGPFVLFDADIDEIIEFMNGIEEGEDMPVVTDKSYLTLSLKEGRCVLCGHVLGEEEKKKIERDLEILSKSQEIVDHRSKLLRGADQIRERRNEFLIQIEEINKDIANLRDDISALELEIKEIDRTLDQFNADEIVRKWEKLKRDETRKDQLIADKTRLEAKVEELEKEYEKILEKIEVLAIATEERMKLKREIEFLERLIKLAERLKREVKEDIRREIKKEAERLFKSIVWNPESFDRLEVDEAFGVKVYHKGTNLDMTYELSGGQSKILTMAFAVALHRVIKYDSPIIVDRPITGISGDQLIESMVKMFVEIAESKQVILLLADDELKGEPQARLEEEASSVWIIDNPTGDEAQFVPKVGGMA